MKYTTVFFDFDDTLIDTIANTRATLNEIYTDYNIKKYYPTFEDFADVFFPHNNQLWKQYSLGKIEKQFLLTDRFYHPFADIDEITLEIANEMNRDFLSRVVTKGLRIDGTIELLDYLTGKYKLHIISNGFTEMQYTKMKNAGVESYFDKVILSDAVGINKPHPDIFHFALKEANASVEESIMIGDNILSDIGGALSVGMDNIWFNPDGKDAEGVTPTYTVNHLSKIKNIL